MDSVINDSICELNYGAGDGIRHSKPDIVQYIQAMDIPGRRDQLLKLY